MNSRIDDYWGLLAVFFIAWVWVIDAALRRLVDKLIDHLTDGD